MSSVDLTLQVIKNNKDFLDQSLDEIKLLRYINTVGDADEHNVLILYEYFYHKEHLILVTEVGTTVALLCLASLLSTLECAAHRLTDSVCPRSC